MILGRVGLSNERSSVDSSWARPTILGPTLTPHRLFDRAPDALDDLAVAPASLRTLLGIVFVDLGLDHAAAPALDGGGDLLGSPAKVDPLHHSEELGWVLPLVAFELPELAGGEDSDDALPGVGTELLGGVNEDEAYRA